MTPDLKVVAQDGSPMLTAKVRIYYRDSPHPMITNLMGQLAMSVLLVGFYSPNSNQRMVEVMSGLGQRTMSTIAVAIQELESLDQRMAELGVDQELTAEPDTSDLKPPRGSSVERDPDLEREAQLIEANREIKQLNAKISTLTTDLERSRNRVSTLEEELVESRLMLDGRGRKELEDDDFEHMRSEVMRDRTYIAELESSLASEKALVSSQERQLERLKADSDTKQDLRDELQLVKAERDELSQKAKANENLRKKIHTLQEQQKANESLRQDLQLAQEQLQQTEGLRERCAALEKANKENVQTIANGEQSLFEEKGRRTRVEHENNVLLRQLEQARELQTRAEDWRKELEERVRELESNGHAARGGSLEDELGTEDATETSEEPPRALTDSIFTSETIMLQQKVEILSSRLRSIEKQYLDLLQENLGLKSDMKAKTEDDESQRYVNAPDARWCFDMLEGLGESGIADIHLCSSPFLEQNERLEATEIELREMQRRFREKELENAELRNELSKSKTERPPLETSADPSGASSNADPGSDGNSEVQNLRANHESLLASYDALQKHSKGLETSLDEKSSLLRTALIDHDELPEGLIELRSAELLKEIREQIENVTSAPLDDRSKVLETTASCLAERLERGQMAVEAAKKVGDLRLPQSNTRSASSSSFAWSATLKTPPSSTSKSASYRRDSVMSSRPLSVFSATSNSASTLSSKKKPGWGFKSWRASWSKAPQGAENAKPLSSAASQAGAPKSAPAAGMRLPAAPARTANPFESPHHRRLSLSPRTRQQQPEHALT